MTLRIISPSEILFSGEAESITLPGVMGSFTVLRNHAPLISVLQKGDVAYRLADGSEHTVGINGGLADVNDNVVAVCVH